MRIPPSLLQGRDLPTLGRLCLTGIWIRDEFGWKKGTHASGLVQRRELSEIADLSLLSEFVMASGTLGRPTLSYEKSVSVLAEVYLAASKQPDLAIRALRFLRDRKTGLSETLLEEFVHSPQDQILSLALKSVEDFKVARELGAYLWAPLSTFDSPRGHDDHRSYGRQLLKSNDWMAKLYGIIMLAASSTETGHEDIADIEDDWQLIKRLLPDRLAYSLALSEAAPGMARRLVDGMFIHGPQPRRAKRLLDKGKRSISYLRKRAGREGRLSEYLQLRMLTSGSRSLVLQEWIEERERVLKARGWKLKGKLKTLMGSGLTFDGKVRGNPSSQELGLTT